MDRWLGRGTDAPARAALALAVLSFLAIASPAGASWHQVGSAVAHSPRRLAVNDLKRIGHTEYVAWTGSNGRNKVVHVARFDNGLWRGVGDVVNHDPRRDAQCASLAAGPGGLPWVAWGEVDGHGVSQIRVAHLSRRTGRWVEPDGRDWAINHRPPIWSFLYREEGQRGHAFGSSCPSLAFLGPRPYVGYINYESSGEVGPRVARLGPDGHSWRELAGRSEPQLAQGVSGLQLAVVASKLRAAISWGAQSQPQGHVFGLTAHGLWKGRGCVNCSVGYRTGTIGALAEQDGAPVVIRNAEPDESADTDQAYVLRLKNGNWHVLGGGPLAPRSGGGTLRTAGGRLYAGWSSLAGRRDPAPEHVSRLADDGGSWEQLPDPGPFRDLRLSALDGVPYVAGVTRSGANHVLRVEKLDDVPAPIGPDDGEGSGPGADPKADTAPVLPPTRRSPCGTEYDGDPYGDYMDFSGYRRRFDVRALAGDDDIRGGDRSDCLHGGRGDDTIDSADGQVDRVYCGAGEDRVTADRSDRLHGCERVRYATAG